MYNLTRVYFLEKLFPTPAKLGKIHDFYEKIKKFWIMKNDKKKLAF